MANIKTAGRRKAWCAPFLAQLALTSNVAASARRAKVDVSTVYKLRRTDSGFARDWFAALCEGYDNLELDLLQRLREGELDGGKTKERARRKFDNATAFRLLAAHRETVTRQRGRNDYEHEDAVLASIDAKLDTMRRRLAAREDGAACPPGEPDGQ